MNIKHKVLSIISFISLAVIISFVGVWALTDLDFAVGGDITYTAPVPAIKAEEVSYLSFNYNETTMEAELINSTASQVPSILNIPEKILYNTKEFTVTSIKTGYMNADDGEFGVFLRNTTLKEVTIPKTIKQIPTWTFYHCSNLTNVIISEGVKGFYSTSNGGAFEYCTSLTKIDLPSTITNMGYFTFRGCNNLKEVNLKSINVPFADTYNFCTSYQYIKSCFINCSSSLVIYVPTSSVNLYKSAEYWKDLTIQSKNF